MTVLMRRPSGHPSFAANVDDTQGAVKYRLSALALPTLKGRDAPKIPLAPTADSCTLFTWHLFAARCAAMKQTGVGAHAIFADFPCVPSWRRRHGLRWRWAQYWPLAGGRSGLGEPRHGRGRRFPGPPPPPLTEPAKPLLAGSRRRASGLRGGSTPVLFASCGLAHSFLRARFFAARCAAR
jgi:hypothetical protein